jgi:hypothetical protein
MQLPNLLQTYILEAIQARFIKKTEAVDALAELLNVGKDAVYRRLRGDTLLTPDEIELLVRHYNISLDAYIFRQSDSVFFTFNPFTHTVKTFDDYLTGIHTDLLLLSKLPNVQISYASAEIPIFYYMFFPELFQFKLYVWARTIWHFDFLQKVPFSFDLIPFPFIQKSEEILKLYRQIPSTELWSLNIIDNTLNQIEYHVVSNGFKDPTDALILCEKLQMLVIHMQTMAEYGQKIPLSTNHINEQIPDNFELYHNEMIYTNITIFVESKIGRAVYTSHCNPNFLKTTDIRMCDYTEGWINSIMAKSNKMSKSAEKPRQWFFERLRKRIEMVQTRLKVTLAEDV